MAISIQINGNQYLDLQKEFVGLNYQVFDVGDIESRQGTFSNDFEIPNTGHNREALGFSTVNNVLPNDLSPYQGIPAKVYENNILISKGFVQIIDYSLSSINITFYGDNVDVFALLRGRKLRDSNLRHLRHTYEEPNITDSFTNTSGYIYLPIDYGLFTDRVSTSIASGEIYPAIYLPDVVSAMFRDIGYQVQGSLLNRALFKKSVLPFVNNFFGYSKEFVQSKNFHVSVGPSPGFSIAAGATVKANYINSVPWLGSSVSQGELFDLSNDRYTADDDYTITVTVTTGQGRGMPASPVILDLRLNGVSVTTATRWIEETFTLTPGDYLEVYMTNPTGITQTLGSVFTGTVSQEFVAGSVVHLETVLPDMDQIDFLKFVLSRFVGVMTVDPFSKIVYLNQFNDLNNNEVDDWSDKIDLSKEVETNYSDLVSGYSKINIAKYAEDDSDVELEKYKVDNGLTFGSGQFELDNDFVDDSKTIFETKFAGTMLIDSFGASAVKLPYIPRHLPDEEDINVPAPRILTVYGNIDLDSFSQISSMTILGTSVSQIPFSYFYKPVLGIEVDDYKESLAFSFQDIGIVQDTGAFDKDYLNLISILNNSQIKRAYLKLNQIDIVNLNFLKKKYIERFGGYFYLNLIEDYDASGDSVLCELVKIS